MGGRRLVPPPSYCLPLLPVRLQCSAVGGGRGGSTAAPGTPYVCAISRTTSPNPSHSVQDLHRPLPS